MSRKASEKGVPMTDERINWRWPATRGNAYAPWYVMAWRTIWIVPCFAALVLLCLLCAVCYGLGSAQRLWRDVT